MSGARYTACLFHPMDPRGSKLGGIETHVRLIVSAHPEDFSILFVGVDEIGDCKLGEVTELDILGRKISFFPVIAVPQDEINLASKSVLKSLTLRYAAGVLRYLPRLKGLLKGRAASAELQRNEFALFPKLLGLPSVQMIHNEGSKNDEMDSLLKRYWYLHQFNERAAITMADHIFGVNPNIVSRINMVYPWAAAKTEMLTVSVDTKRFAAQPFDCRDGIFRIVFAGRLDAFKDPPLMFRVLGGLHARLAGRLEFHYVGPSDPQRFGEFAAIAPFTIRHGSKMADEVAAIMAKAHAGIITSFFEGMPCYLLEMLSTGRPVGAIRLPQFDPLILEGVSGSLVERTDPIAPCEAELIDTFARLWQGISTGGFDPQRIHACVAPYSLENQMSRLFARHRSLQDKRFQRLASTSSIKAS